MPRTALDLISVVEAAYRLDGTEEAWLGDVLAACAPGFADRFGSAAVVFEREVPDPRRILSTTVVQGMSTELLATARGGFTHGTHADRDRSLRQGGPVLRLRDIVQGPLVTHPMYASLAQREKFDDMIALRAVNPDGTGVFFAAATHGKQSVPLAGRWPELAAHVAAGLRLRRRAKRLAKTDAILSPRGELLDGSKSGISAREALREAVRRVEHARGQRNDVAAIDAWTALVEGRWSLVDRFESDGKRFLVAVQNAANAPDPRALDNDERPILHFVAMGHTNKLIAYELGLPLGTVATRLGSVMRKLGVRSRVEIIERYTALRAAQLSELDDLRAIRIDPKTERTQSLTSAEADVAQRAARGESTKRIAKARGCSPRTVENLLGRVYAKLDVTSRSQLALALDA